jgi:hypothetical protein
MVLWWTYILIRDHYKKSVCLVVNSVIINQFMIHILEATTVILSTGKVFTKCFSYLNIKQICRFLFCRWITTRYLSKIRYGFRYINNRYSTYCWNNLPLPEIWNISIKISTIMWIDWLWIIILCSFFDKNKKNHDYFTLAFYT